MAYTQLYERRAGPGWSHTIEVRSGSKATQLLAGLPAWARPIPGGLLVAVATLAVGWYARAFRGFPKGYDTLGHLAKIHLLIANFPHVNWNPAWYSGAPYFAGSYPPGYHAVVAVLCVTTGISASQCMVTVAAVSMLMITLGLYGLVWVVTGRTPGALIAVALVLGGPTQWSQILQAGLYPRLLGMGFAAIALATAASYAKRPSRPMLLATTLAVAASASVHPLSGVLGGALVAVVIFAMSDDRYRALVQAGIVGAASVALAGYFYVPYLLQNVRQNVTNLSLQPIPWSSLVRVDKTYLSSWSPVLVPAVLVAVVMASLAWWRLRSRSRVVSPALPGILLRQPATTVHDDDAVRRSLLTAASLAAAAAAIVAYCVAGHFKHSFGYLQDLDPIGLLTYPEWLLAAGCGIVIGASRNLVPRPTLGFAVPAGVLAACAVAGLVVVIPLLPGAATSYQGALTQFEQSFAASLPDQQQFRVACNDPSCYEPLNVVTTSPQTNGYQDQAVANPDYQYWLSDATSEPAWNADERLFLLDWYAAGWVFTTPGPGNARPYQSDPGKFRELASNSYGPVVLFKVREPNPIVSVSNAPTVLVIGDSSHYETFLRALADSNIGSSRLVPVYGGDYADGLGQAELARYDTVFLYGARSHDPARADALLSAYVRHGGRLVDDAGDQGAYPALAPSGSGVLPVASAITGAAAGSWAFTAAPGMIDPASLRRFSPPNYANSGLWQIEQATRLQPAAQALLRSRGAVVLADRQLGAGQVYWSGLNLPYHVATFKNAPESALLGNLVGAAGAAVPSPVLAPSVTAERIQVTATGRGLLVKENWARDWRATVDGRAVPVESAGPGMMYIPLPGNGPADIVLAYHLSHVELGGILLSLAAILVLFAAMLPFRQRMLLLAGIGAGHPLRTGKQQREAVIRTVLTQTGTANRAAALRLVAAQEKLGPYADVLLNLTRTETDVAVLDELVRIATLHQWEPIQSSQMAAFRHWASQRSRSSHAFSRV